MATSIRPTLVFLHDPLCGWCYALAPVVEALAERFDALAPVTMLHAGLFSREGGRTLTADFAAYAWQNDQRIHALTGQPFSDAYRTRVLGNPRVRMDSWPAALALQIVREQQPARELAALHALQSARFVGGRDLTDPEVLAGVGAGVGIDREVFLAALADDRVLVERAEADLARAQGITRALGARGVPLLLLDGIAPLPTVLPHGDWLGNPGAAVKSLASILDAAAR